MKLLTINVHAWIEENQDEKMEILAKVIAENDYDVIAMQEVNQSMNSPVLFRAIRQDNLHAVLTGVSLTIAALLHATAGFNFSAGLIDFILTSRLPMANNPWLLIVLGVVMFAVYFFVFDFLIKKSAKIGRASCRERV